MTLRLGSAVLIVCALAGCADAPSSSRPGVALPSRWTTSDLPSLTAGVDDPRDRAQSLSERSAQGADWWSAFGGSRVDTLVRSALAANPNMAAAAATLRQAQELTRAQSATLWPTLSASIGAVQAHGENASVINSGAPRSRTALVSASYAPDLFGVNADNLASSQATEDAARWQLEGARLTLAGATLNALTIEKSALRVEQLTERLADIDAAVLDILRARESLGDVPSIAVWAQSQQLHDRRAQLAAARLQTAQARDLLASLLGDAPGNFVEPDFDFDQLALPDIAPGLPGNVVERRPDVRMAAAQLRAANAAHQAAIAALLPQIMINADAGDVSTSIRRLLDPASLVWDLSLSVTQSLFDAGAQRHRMLAAQALADAQSSQYRATLVAAFRDVADGLESVRHDAQADVEALARAQSAQRQFEIASVSEALGQISHQDALAAQAQMIQMQILQTQIRTSRLVDASNVLVALGGSRPTDGAEATATSSARSISPIATASFQPTLEP